MDKVNTLYRVRKEQIYNFYSKYKNIDADSIQDVNDKIVDLDLKKEDFDNPLSEFYNIVSMCSYMIDNNLYDEYFFNTYDDILEEYKSGSFGECFLDINEDKKSLGEDIYKINEYLSNDNDKMNYYDTLSEIYSKEDSK